MLYFRWANASYKGGKIIGSINKPEDPQTTVLSIMVSSLMTKFSTIVRLVPLDSSSAEALLPMSLSRSRTLRAVIFTLMLCVQKITP